jgi:hypothetical protein
MRIASLMNWVMNELLDFWLMALREMATGSGMEDIFSGSIDN